MSPESRARKPLSTNPEFPILVDFVRESFLEESGYKPLNEDDRRMTKYIARAIEALSGPRKEQVPILSELEEEMKDDESSFPWVLSKARRLQPSWMHHKNLADIVANQF